MTDMTPTRADDEARRLVTPPPPDIGIRQGILEAWNPATLANTVDLAGTKLTDLPVQAVGSVALAVGDTVALLRYGATFFIVGVIRPANAGVGSMSPRAGRVTFSQGNFDTVTSSSFVSPATSGPVLTDVYVGKSRTCLVTVSAQMSVVNCTGYAAYSVNGASTINAADFRGSLLTAAGGSGTENVASTVTKVALLTAADGLNEGLHTFTFRVRRDFAGAGAVYALTDRDLIVQPF